MSTGKCLISAPFISRPYITTDCLTCSCGSALSQASLSQPFWTLPYSTGWGLISYPHHTLPLTASSFVPCGLFLGVSLISRITFTALLDTPLQYRLGVSIVYVSAPFQLCEAYQFCFISVCERSYGGFLYCRGSLHYSGANV